MIQPGSTSRWPQAALLIFCKAPQRGRVKTRLIPHLGETAATQLHKALSRQTLATVKAANLCRPQLWCAPDPDHAFFRNCRTAYDVELFQQQGPDLGARMQQALTAALAEATFAVVIGTDCPALTPAHLDEALAALAAGHDAVVGPAQDGGYVLLGLREVHPDLFENMPWGTETVLAKTRQRLRRLGWRWHELAPLWDVDRPEDLARLTGIAGF